MTLRTSLTSWVTERPTAPCLIIKLFGASEAPAVGLDTTASPFKWVLFFLRRPIIYMEDCGRKEVEEESKKGRPRGIHFFDRNQFSWTSSVRPTSIMSSRLASFKGPSTPSRNQNQRATPPIQSPSSPGNNKKPIESTFHRKTRAILQELQLITLTWDELVLLDGLKAARKLIDTRTELEWVFSK